MTPDKIEREIVIDAPVTRVWRMVTEAEHLGVWFADAGAKVDLRPGGAVELTWAKHGTAHGRVERVEPERLFAVRWLASMELGNVEPSEGNSTLVEFTLAPEGDATRLKVVESGFASLDGTDHDRIAKHADNTRGWELELEDLRIYAREKAAV